MKKRIYALLAITALMSAVTYSQVSFRVRAGVNFQNINGEDAEGDKYKNDLTPGFHAGADVDIPIAQDFYVQPGLLFSTKGAANVNEEDNQKVSLSYIELPIHVVYKPQLGTGKLILGFGPYLAYAVSGKFKIDEEDFDIEFTNDVVDGDIFTPYLKPLDIGADIFFGYEFSFGLSAQINAQLGLVNLEPKIDGESPEDVTKNTGFGLSLGYRF